ncbi:hypothetical protein HY214_05440 [Candidatus Roizmanbacteria bacterium]|nr:hypothetical protein [Candidatus Roizmanbacteria bacterium]
MIPRLFLPFLPPIFLGVIFIFFIPPTTFLAVAAFILILSYLVFLAARNFFNHPVALSVTAFVGVFFSLLAIHELSVINFILLIGLFIGINLLVK